MIKYHNNYILVIIQFILTCIVIQLCTKIHMLFPVFINFTFHVGMVMHACFLFVCLHICFLSSSLYSKYLRLAATYIGMVAYVQCSLRMPVLDFILISVLRFALPSLFLFDFYPP